MNENAVTEAGYLHRDDTGSRIGMWMFLFTEILLFGGMFILYAVYRAEHPGAFHEAASSLNLLLGTVNTVILLTSSLTMVVAVTAVRDGRPRLAASLLLTTVFCAAVFLVNKYIEWSAEFSHGIVPGSETLLAKDPGEILFFGLYYAMTGLHGIHVAVGALVLAVMAVRVLQGRITADRHIWIENSGLYWHLVDVIWIYLFPLLYLIT